MTSQTEQKVVTAAVLGTVAFIEGRQAVPCLDPALMDLLKGEPIGDAAIAILKAWTRSWCAANLAQEIAA